MRERLTCVDDVEDTKKAGIVIDLSNATTKKVTADKVIASLV
jgi:hypothetical protein